LEAELIVVQGCHFRNEFEEVAADLRLLGDPLSTQQLYLRLDDGRGYREVSFFGLA
jgi:hypothetical protein